MHWVFTAVKPTSHSYIIKTNSMVIVRRRSNGYVDICLFVNIEIQRFGWHIHKSGVVLKLFVVSMDSLVGRFATSRRTFFHYAQIRIPRTLFFVNFIV